jgi:erythromycin esterase
VRRLRRIALVALVALLGILAVIALPASARVRAAGRTVDDPPAQWLQRYATILTTAEPHAASDADLQPLLDLARNARVVALGDATHGTHELFALKQRIVPLLAANGFRTLALEAPYAELQRIRDSIRTGQGDPAALLISSDYFFWDTDEVLDLLHWAREEQVDVVGLDSAHPAETMELVVETIRDADPALAADAAFRYDCLVSNQNHYAAQPPSDREVCRALILSVRPKLEALRPHFAADAFDDLLHAARVAEQGEESLFTSLANRDRAMAENLAWLAGRGKVVVWGHNEHFGKTPYQLTTPTPVDSAGRILAAQLGNAYVAIGSVILGGTFNAFEYEPATRTKRIHDLPMTAASSDDYATFLHQHGAPLLFVPLHTPLPTWLAMTHRIRFAGSGGLPADRATLDVVVNLAAKFDAVVYLELSTPTRLRHYPRS